MCVSLCAQPPSSKDNPSVAICGIEAYVDHVYNILIQYHLVDPVVLPTVPHYSPQDKSEC